MYTQPILGIIQFLLGVCNQLGVGADLVVEGDDLIVEQRHFLIDGIFLCHHIFHFAEVCVVQLPDGIDLRLNGVVLLLQNIDLLLDLRRGCSSCSSGHYTRHQSQHQKKRDDCTCFSVSKVQYIHCYTSINLRIEVQLPTIPTNIPAKLKTTTMGISSSWKGTKLNSCRESTPLIFCTSAS